MTRFLRRVWSRYPKLGRGRRKKQKWRKPKGRDNKMREKRKGYPVVVSIGYRKNAAERKKIKVVSNIKDLKNITEEDIVVLGKIGKKKKIEVLKKAWEMKISVQNINAQKFLKKMEKNKVQEENKLKNSENGPK